MRNLVMSIMVCTLVVACGRKTKTKTEYVTKLQEVETVAFTEQDKAQWQAKVNEAEAETVVAEERAATAEEALVKSQEELAIHKSLVDTRMRLRVEYFTRTEGKSFFTNSDPACWKHKNLSEKWALELASKDIRHILELIDSVTEDESNLDFVAFLQKRINTATPEEESTNTWTQTAENIWETEFSAYQKNSETLQLFEAYSNITAPVFSFHDHVIRWNQFAAAEHKLGQKFRNSVEKKLREAHQRHAWKLYGKCL